MRSERKNPFFLVYSNTRHTMKSVATSNTQFCIYSTWFRLILIVGLIVNLNTLKPHAYDVCVSPLFIFVFYFWIGSGFLPSVCNMPSDKGVPASVILQISYSMPMFRAWPLQRNYLSPVH